MAAAPCRATCKGGKTKDDEGKDERASAKKANDSGSAVNALHRLIFSVVSADSWPSDSGSPVNTRHARRLNVVSAASRVTQPGNTLIHGASPRLCAAQPMPGAV